MVNLAFIRAAPWATVIATRRDEVYDLLRHRINLSNDDLGSTRNGKRGIGQGICRRISPYALLTTRHLFA